MQRFEAALIIQKNLRGYNARKNILIKKPALLENQPHENDLFSCAKNIPVLFRQAGWRGLFKEKNGQFIVNFWALDYYLKKNIDIRQWVLEAYLRNAIDQNLMLTLFEIQTSWHDYSPKSPEASREGLFRLFKIHEFGVLTPATIHLLLPYLIQCAPAIVKQDIITLGDYCHRIKAQLLSLPQAHNFFSHIILPPFRLLNYLKLLIERELIFFNQITHNVEVAPDLEHFVHTMLEVLRKHFNYSSIQPFFDLEEVTYENGSTGKEICLESDLLTYLIDLEEQKKNRQLNEAERKKIQTDWDFRADAETLIVASLKKTREFTPLSWNSSQDFHTFGNFIIGAEIQDRWLFAVSEKNPKVYLPKIIKFGKPQVADKNRITEKINALVGLEYPGIAVTTNVHGRFATPNNYMQHDTRFHYPAMFYYLAFAETIYKLDLYHIKIIQQVTKNQDGIVSYFLDYDNSFFYLHLKNLKYDEDVLKSMLSHEPKINSSLIEYRLILVCHIIKHLNWYQEELKQAQLPMHVDDLVKIFFDWEMFNIQLDEDYYAQLFLHDFFQEIEGFSYSLGVFFMMFLFHFDNKPREILALCKDMQKLELSDPNLFKWNPKDGIMMNIDNHSYRFVNHAEDPRLKKHYRTNKQILFINHPKWLEKLATQVIEKIDTLPSITR